MITVGKFSYDPEHEVISGPEQYWDEQGMALLKKILAGDDLIFNLSARQSPDVMTALLVRLQTDYAGWKGMHDLWRDLGLQSRDEPRRTTRQECACCQAGTFVLGQHGECATCEHEHLDHVGAQRDEN